MAIQLEDQIPLERKGPMWEQLACPRALLPLTRGSFGKLLPYLPVGPPLGLGTPEDQILVGLEEVGPAPPSSTVTSESASHPLLQIP